ncbi:MAG: rhomboid family intramembrane serine protease, partial [Planctomycetales bacterium]
GERQSAAEVIKRELIGVAGFVGVVWAMYLLSLVVWSLSGLDLNAVLGLQPRTLWGLPGILVSPFLHADLMHLFGNTIPLFILLALLASSKARWWTIVGAIILLGGGLLWLLGRSQEFSGKPLSHVGASGLVFGLISFLIFSGALERRMVSLAVAAVVLVFYGSTLLIGVLPLDSEVSWDGHLCGAVAGGLIAYGLTLLPSGNDLDEIAGDFDSLK